MVLNLGMKGIFHQSITILKIIKDTPNEEEVVTMITADDAPRTTEKEDIVIPKRPILEKVSILDLAK